MSAIARLYQAQFDRSPSRTLMVTNGFLSSLADTSAQCIELFAQRPDLDPELARSYDPFRTLRFFLYSSTMGPLAGRWNKYLEHAFPLRSVLGGKVSLPSLTKRVAADQMVM
ncbi:hypothetical protein FRB94_009482 [Tulasnella sp. JGI-2019a]|nr:hypothetical protein FRB94_009482 [Tulasnella sp. JGI-2019a]